MDSIFTFNKITENHTISVSFVESVFEPTADFIVSDSIGTAPLTVQFSDLSTNNPTGWLWNFGDGDSSIVQNPTHTYYSAGTYTVRLTATNSAGTHTITKTNYIIIINQTPKITAMSDTTIYEGDTFTRQVYATDPDEDDITFSLNSYPSGMTIELSSGTITWTPDYTQSGTYPVTVKAEDGKGGEDSTSFTLTVNDVPRLPEITAMMDTTINEGDMFKLQVYAIDPDGDDITFLLISFPSEMKINENTGLITWQTTKNDSGDYNIIVQADDGKGGQDTASFIIYVNNVAPKIIISDTTISFGRITIGDSVIRTFTIKNEGNDTLYR